MENSLCVQGRNKLTDSDSFREKTGLQGTEISFHSPELLPANSNSFLAVQEPPSQGDDFRYQGNLKPKIS